MHLQRLQTTRQNNKNNPSKSAKQIQNKQTLPRHAADY
jgi:hypothetical protein